MHNALKAAVISVLVAGAGFAQEQQQQPVVEQVVPNTAPFENSIGVHTGLNLGLVEIDIQRGHFYGFVSSALGVPLASDGKVAVGALGLGYTAVLSSTRDAAWNIDLYANGLGGKMDLSGFGGGAYGGFGVGVGFRYQHRSGFTLGFKIPVFGVSVGDAAESAGRFNGSASLGAYYLGYLCSQAPLTIGFRF